MICREEGTAGEGTRSTNGCVFESFPNPSCVKHWHSHRWGRRPGCTDAKSQRRHGCLLQAHKYNLLLPRSRITESYVYFPTRSWIPQISQLPAENPSGQKVLAQEHTNTKHCFSAASAFLKKIRVLNTAVSRGTFEYRDIQTSKELTVSPCP